MERYDGTTRIVFVGQRYVFKLARIDPNALHADHGEKWIRKELAEKGRFAKIFPGVVTNWREYVLWRQTKDSIFWPTLFSCWFVNIQHVAPVWIRGEQDQSRREWQQETLYPLMYTLRKHPRFQYIDLHHFTSAKDYCVTSGGTKMIDYGDPRIREVTESPQGRELIRSYLQQSGAD